MKKHKLLICMFALAMSLVPLFGETKANALSLSCSDLIGGADIAPFLYIAGTGSTSDEANDWISRCNTEMQKDPCKSAPTIPSDSQFKSCMNALKGISEDIMGISLSNTQFIEFNRLCTASPVNGTTYFTHINGQPWFYCSQDYCHTPSCPGGSTLSEALKKIEITVCNDTIGKQWNYDEGRCEDIPPRESGGGGTSASDCVETSYFDDVVCADGNLIPNTILTILNWALVGVGTVVVIIIVVGGIRYMTAAGNAETAKQARKMIMNAVLALVLYVVMITVLNFIIPGGVFSGT